MKISITSESQYPIDRQRIREKISDFLEGKAVVDDQEVQVDVCFIGDRKMKQLNKEYLDRDKTTDVLSFSLQEKGREVGEDVAGQEFVVTPENIFHLGEVIISYPQARKQAQENELLVDQEIDRLVIHGLKHLLGIDHK